MYVSPFGYWNKLELRKRGSHYDTPPCGRWSLVKISKKFDKLVMVCV